MRFTIIRHKWILILCPSDTLRNEFLVCNPIPILILFNLPRHLSCNPPVWTVVPLLPSLLCFIEFGIIIHLFSLSIACIWVLERQMFDQYSSFYSSFYLWGHGFLVSFPSHKQVSLWVFLIGVLTYSFVVSICMAYCRAGLTNLLCFLLFVHFPYFIVFE